MVDFEKHRIRSKLEARILDAGAADVHAAYGERKQATIGAMRGTVVELGPGTGVNMRYYAPETKVIAIEPNPLMHELLQARADEHGVNLEIRSLRGESIDVDDASVDGVVGTLLLCGVDDPAQVVREAHRVLRPGATYFFTEHVQAPAGSRTRLAQRILLRPHRWCFNGCEVDRDTGALLHASPFSTVEFEEVDRGRAGLHVRHQIIGQAIK
ncbi:MAG: class I SAM-dependent methyltransferase [Ilumatobacter sp.]